MIIIKDTLVSEEIFEKQFVCDLQACKGACCIEGSSGAPLEAEETGILEEIYDIVAPYLRPEGRAVIEANGLYEMDSDGDLVTPLVGEHGACAFVTFDANGIAKCGIEQAYLDGKISWRKPISCHLYPVRLQQLTEYVAVNYHRWQVCDPACNLGQALGVPVFQFLKEPLTRKFGAEWYQEAEEVFQALSNDNG
jgi:hypothetical protein